MSTLSTVYLAIIVWRPTAMDLSSESTLRSVADTLGIIRMKVRNMLQGIIVRGYRRSVETELAPNKQERQENVEVAALFIARCRHCSGDLVIYTAAVREVAPT